MTDWDWKWLTTWEEVWHPANVERWQALLGRAESPHVFFTPPLVRAWWSACPNIHCVVPRFLWATSSDGATVFLPLVAVGHGWKNAGLRTLQPVGCAEYDYHDPIAQGMEPEQWPAFWSEFARKVKTRWGGTFDRFVLNGLRTHPIGNSASFSERAPYLPIAAFPTADAFLAALGKSLRGDIRRQIRRLEELGPVSFRVLHAGETKTALSWLPEMLACHAEKWPNSYKLPGFHDALVREALPAGLLHFSELRVGETAVSRHLGFFFQRRFYWYLPVYDPAYQKCSPGKVLLYFCAIDAIKRGGEIFDLLRGEEGYKHEWTTHASELFEIGWPDASLGATVRLALADTVKPLLRRIVRVRR